MDNKSGRTLIVYTKCDKAIFKQYSETMILFNIWHRTLLVPIRDTSAPCVVVYIEPVNTTPHN